ncbi:chromodomain-helicase-DNA-binding protein 7-like [Heptranchias perlo]|uniref:chromodomain-helicase-DNA-binding protein 7-like n=1 Tax=Heptranchias perlo TaxID=212740 RepID=UPI00355A4142
MVSLDRGGPSGAEHSVVSCSPALLFVNPVSSIPSTGQEDGLKLTFHKQRRKRRKKLEMEAERARLRQYMSGPREAQSASDSGQETGADCSRPTPLTPSALLDHSFPLKFTQEPGRLDPDTVRSQLDAVLSASSNPLWRNSVNGQVADGQSLAKKRRGRRKNVEGTELLLLAQSKGMGAANGETDKSFEEAQPRRPETDLETRIPVVSKVDGTVLAGEEAPRRRELDEWLKEHPDFGVDPSCLGFIEDRPKQKRHRCRNPLKLDVKALTGEERVPVINRRNGKKLGGGFAPPIKDLQKWLQENMEYGIAQEWADVIKQSGYLPEDMFDRILTGPVVPEEGRRRGRRPKHLAAAMQVNSLLASGMLDVNSLQAFQKNLQSLQLAGLMGYPGETKEMTGGLAATDPSAGPLTLGGCGSEPSQTNAARRETWAAGQQRETLCSPAQGDSLTLNSLVLSNMYGGMFLPQGFGMGMSELSLSGLGHPGTAKTHEARAGAFGVTEQEADGDDDLSQGYDSTDEKGDYSHSLIDDPMMPTNSDFSGED